MARIHNLMAATLSTAHAPLSPCEAATVAASRSRWTGLRVLPVVGALDRDLVGHESGVVPDAPNEGRPSSALPGQAEEIHARLRRDAALGPPGGTLHDD